MRVRKSDGKLRRRKFRVYDLSVRTGRSLKLRAMSVWKISWHEGKLTAKVPSDELVYDATTFPLTRERRGWKFHYARNICWRLSSRGYFAPVSPAWLRLLVVPLHCLAEKRVAFNEAAISRNRVCRRISAIKSN